MSSKQPILIELGGPEDQFPDFPSTLSAKARRHYAETGQPLRVWTMGHHVINFIQTHCVLTDSHYAGQPFLLMPWQKRVLLEMYIVNEDLIRIHRWALIGVGKKNGKTELASGLGIYHAVDDDEVSARVICAAASEDQAGLLYTAAQRICEWSPTLSRFSTVEQQGITFNTGLVPSELRKVAAAAGTNDGKNLSATLIDELHEWIAPKHRAVFTVLTQGGGARRQPLNVMITTAGSDQESVCYELYEHGQMVIAGDIEDDSFYFVWFEAPADWDYRDPETWKKANPSWGLILQEDFYRDIITKRSESEFCRYFLNRWMDADDIWEAAQYWDELAGDSTFDVSLPIYVGIDIGRRHDTAAVVACQWTGERLRVQTRFWINPYKAGDPRHDRWSLTIAEVEQHLVDLYEQYPESAVTDEDGYREVGPAFAYDPMFFVRSAELLRDRGLNFVEFPQTDSRMIAASQNIFELIKTGQVVHDGSRIMSTHMRSVKAKQKERGWRISRPEGSRKPTDGAVALAMSAYLASAEFQKEETITILDW